MLARSLIKDSKPLLQCIHTNRQQEKDHSLSMEVFLGKWKSEASEGFEEYLHALGKLFLAQLLPSKIMKCSDLMS